MIPPDWPVQFPAEGWHVEVPMPFYTSGKRAGEPVGWLTSNNRPASVKGKIARDAAEALWRISCRDSMRRHGVPKDLNRVLVTFQARYATGTRGNHRHDWSNLEDTFKPLQDALQPERVEVQKRKGGRGSKVIVHYGWGVIPNDNAKHLIRGGQMPTGEDLPKGCPHRGVIVLGIYPLPAAAQ